MRNEIQQLNTSNNKDEITNTRTISQERNNLSKNDLNLNNGPKAQTISDSLTTASQSQRLQSNQQNFQEEESQNLKYSQEHHRFPSKDRSATQQIEQNYLEEDDTMNRRDFNERSSKNEDSIERLSTNNSNACNNTQQCNIDAKEMMITPNSDRILPDQLSEDIVAVQCECQQQNNNPGSQQVALSKLNKEQTDETFAKDNNQSQDKQQPQQPKSISIENIQKSSQSARRATSIKSTYPSAYLTNPLKVYSATKLKLINSTLEIVSPYRTNILRFNLV